MKPLLLLLVSLSSLAAGLGLGRALRPPPLGTPAPLTDPATATARRPAAPGTPVLPAITSRRQSMESILAYLHGDRSRSLPELLRSIRGDEAALRLLADSSLDLDPEGFFRSVVTEWGPGPLDDTFSWVSSFIWKLSQRDPAAAIRICLDLEGKDRDDLLVLAVITLLPQDPATALSLLSRNPTLDLWEPSTVPVPATAQNLALVRGMEPSRTKKNLLATLAASLPPDEGYALCASDRHLVTDNVWNAAAYAMVEQDPDAVKAWCETHPQHPATPNLAMRTAHRLTVSNPTEAIAWIRDHYHGSLRNKYIEAAARKLDQTDPAAAAAARELLPSAYKYSAKP